ncbi:YY1-associated factor 2 [Bacillus rossius redtenbacheri]|uniref:YY1-associated factor 2 n=1 Tax=Bacillus rossius redtenbacheri TaxID=93214 RepID=UPI002FDE7B61
MESKQSGANQHSSQQKAKRPAKVLDESHWDCSVCTYRNNAEAFKCLMCDVRKGTSTRKPKINPQLVAQVAQYAPTTLKALKKEGGPKDGSSKESPGKDKPDKKHHAGGRVGKRSCRPPRLKNVDRSSARTLEITVNNVTVAITEYKPKVKKSASAENSGRCSSASSENSSHSESSTDVLGGDMGTDSRSS